MSKRPHCNRCSRPLVACICKHIQPVANRVSLRILQHPLEVNEPKNTARLLQLCLQNSQIFVGEIFSKDFFHAHLSSSAYNLLLYPETSEEKSLGIESPPVFDYAQICVHQTMNRLGAIHLWVIDGTWRKSRKMLYLNPELQRMPRLSLEDCPSSQYTIRKSQGENQLSTLEATCYALQQLENNSVNYAPVLAAFAAFINQLQTYLPANHPLDRL
jgi:DTW domain-containing protein